MLSPSLPPEEDEEGPDSDTEEYQERLAELEEEEPPEEEDEGEGEEEEEDAVERMRGAIVEKYEEQTESVTNLQVGWFVFEESIYSREHHY